MNQRVISSHMDRKKDESTAGPVTGKETCQEQGSRVLAGRQRKKGEEEEGKEEDGEQVKADW